MSALHQTARGRIRPPIASRSAATSAKNRSLSRILLEHVEAFRQQVQDVALLEHRPARRGVCGFFSRKVNMTGVLRSAMVATRQSDRRAHWIARRDPDLQQRLRRIVVTGDAEGPEPGRRSAEELLKARVGIGKLERLDQVVLV